MNNEVVGGVDSLRGCLGRFLVTVMVAGAGVCSAQTAIKTDASWGRTPQKLGPSATATSFTSNAGKTLQVPGNLYVVPQSLGQKAGANLFHSFDTLNIGSGDAAVFTTADPFNNVITRVSGGAHSSISGILSLLPGAGKPNFFLINPNGIVFSEGAQIDMPAAFHVSTANHLRFGDGIVFRAGTGADSTLTTAAPAAFGFLGTTRAPILVNDMLMESARGAGIDVIAGDVEINNAALLARGGGDVRVAAVGNDVVEIGLQGPLPLMHGILNIVNAGEIVTASTGARSSGNIILSGGEVSIDGQASGATFTGVTSVSGPGTTGNAGDVTINASGKLSLVDGAIVSSDSYTNARTGAVTVSAGSILLDGRGNTEAVDVLGDPTRTQITSCACLPGTPFGAGSITVIATGDVSMLNRGQVTSLSGGPLKAGAMTVSAGSLTIDNQRSRGIFSFNDGPGGGADITVTVAGSLRLTRGATIQASTYKDGAAGNVTVKAASLVIDEQDSPQPTGIFSTAEAHSTGISGDVDVSVSGPVTILSGGAITSDTFGPGHSGSLKLHAGEMYIDPRGSMFGTGLSSQANEGSGDAGRIDVVIDGTLTLVNGGFISSSTFSDGNAAAISVKADNIDIRGALNVPYTGILAFTQEGSTGRSGDIEVSVAHRLSIQNAYGVISSFTSTEHDAGSVKISAEDVFIKGVGSEGLSGIFSSTAGGGKAGNVELTAGGTVNLVDAGTITASTSGSGAAGSVKVRAANLIIDGLDDPSAAFGIQAGSLAKNSGHAGSVDIVATQGVWLVHRGFISVSTSSEVGEAGSVNIDTGTLLVDGTRTNITARAGAGSSGQTGSVTIHASKSITVSNGGALTMENAATVADPSSVKRTLLSVSAPSITVINDGQITTQSSGNVAASDIRLHFDGRLVIDPSRIATTAADGNGGAIRIDGAGTMLLDHSQITTSVSGLVGNGGDIAIHTGALVMNTGFIQANTAGKGARGGNVH
jgi:filamentous hemagglutinin family protein